MRLAFRPPLGEDIENPAMELLHQLIVSPDPGYWDEGSGGGTVDYFTEQSKTSLMIFPHSTHGVYLRFYDEKNNPWLSLGNKEKLSECVECNDEWYISVGLFVAKEKAWLAVRDFCLSGRKSPEVKWIPPSEIPDDGNW